MVKKFSKVFHKKFGKRLRELRLDKGITQEELSLEIGTDNSYISNIENARYDIPLSRVRMIAQALQIDIKDMFEFK